MKHTLHLCLGYFFDCFNRYNLKSLGIMRSLVLVIAILTTSLTGFATNDETSQVKLSNDPFIVSFESLNRYLDLSPNQINKVYDINNYFIETQNNYMKLNAYLKEKKMQQAVYGNLKLMKDALSPEQYKKYLTLLNVTNTNRMIDNTEVNIYLTDKCNL